jgi:hypothetical protein
MSTTVWYDIRDIRFELHDICDNILCVHASTLWTPMPIVLVSLKMFCNNHSPPHYSKQLPVEVRLT